MRLIIDINYFFNYRIVHIITIQWQIYFIKGSDSYKTVVAPCSKSDIPRVTKTKNLINFNAIGIHVFSKRYFNKFNVL